MDYDPAGPGHEPVLHWVDDNTLSVNLGRVYWVSSQADRVGNIHVIYIYSKVDTLPLKKSLGHFGTYDFQRDKGKHFLL